MPRILFKKLNVKEQNQIFAGEVVNRQVATLVNLECNGDEAPCLGKSTGTITCLLSSTGHGGGGTGKAI
jgi:hypothetical protein